MPPPIEIPVTYDGPDGCAARRAARMSASVALTRSGSSSLSANEARATTSRGPRFERR